MRFQVPGWLCIKTLEAFLHLLGTGFDVRVICHSVSFGYHLCQTDQALEIGILQLFIISTVLVRSVNLFFNPNLQYAITAASNLKNYNNLKTMFAAKDLLIKDEDMRRILLYISKYLKNIYRENPYGLYNFFYLIRDIRSL